MFAIAPLPALALAFASAVCRPQPLTPTRRWIFRATHPKKRSNRPSAKRPWRHTPTGVRSCHASGRRRRSRQSATRTRCSRIRRNVNSMIRMAPSETTQEDRRRRSKPSTPEWCTNGYARCIRGRRSSSSRRQRYSRLSIWRYGFEPTWRAYTGPPARATLARSTMNCEPSTPVSSAS